jgi:hypothetical protein
MFKDPPAAPLAGAGIHTGSSVHDSFHDRRQDGNYGE